MTQSNLSIVRQDQVRHYLKGGRYILEVFIGIAHRNPSRETKELFSHFIPQARKAGALTNILLFALIFR